MAQITCPSIGPCRVQLVLLVDLLERLQPDYRFVASSLPGHLIQVMIEGKTDHEANGRRYVLRPRSLIWYHEDELVRGHALESPWRFYTLNFIAPSLAPPPFEQRVRSVDAAMMRRFARLLSVWRDVQQPPAVREMRVQAQLLDILSNLHTPGGQAFVTDPSADLWWNMETQLRRDLARPIDLSMMSDLSGKSIATIARSCQSAVNLPPMKRIKQIRMSLARGLVRQSNLSVTEIAGRVGYGRVHEFSRDYRKHHGSTPTEDRGAERGNPKPQTRNPNQTRMTQ